MIVWSRGLGRQRLPLDLPAATLSVTPDNLVLQGVIEPVCWGYAIRLSAGDLAAFLKLLADPKTARFIAEKPDVLVPFVLRLAVLAPQLLLKALVRKTPAASFTGSSNMHFWSEGLGDGELVIGLDHAKVDSKGDSVVLSGVVTAPAPWEYEVRIQYPDWSKILSTATSREACDFIALHAPLTGLAGMAYSVLKFIVLLAFYRLLRFFGFGSAQPSTIGAPSSAGKA
jgi:hypothetical protein